MLTTRTIGVACARLQAGAARSGPAQVRSYTMDALRRSRASTPCRIMPLAQMSQSPRIPRASRTFTSTARRSHGHVHAPKPGEELHITFVDKDGSEHKLQVAAGDNLLDIAQAHDLDMEGACGGSCACSTCHVIVEDDALYEAIPEPEDEENDMLDLAFGLTETSRLGCQVKMTKELDGMVVRLPSMTRNMQSSDFN